MVQSLMLLPVAILEELKQTDTQIDRKNCSLYIKISVGSRVLAESVQCGSCPLSPWNQKIKISYAICAYMESN